MSKARAQEWFKFDPVNIGLEVEGLSPEAEGRYFSLARFLMIRGPQTKAAISTRVGRSFNEIERTLMVVEGGMSIGWVEEGRADILARKKQTSAAGQRSAELRLSRPTEAVKEPSTGVEQTLNTRSTDVQRTSYSKSVSPSSSNSESSSSEKNAREDFDAAWSDYGRHGNRAPALKAWSKLSDEDRAACAIIIPAYAKATNTDGTFPSRKYFATYVNTRAWEDEIPVANKSGRMKAALHSADVPADKYQEGI